MDKKRRNEFIDKIREQGPQSFIDALDAYFPDTATQDGILRVFRQLDLPLPINSEQFMPGTDGMLIFSNKYSLVIRIENKDKKPVKPSQWVLQPLGSVEIGDIVVEICPACKFEDNRDNYKLVKAALKEEGINFWDTGLRNMGRLPFTSKRFPDGVPVVVDRRAVKMMSDAIGPVRLGLQGKNYAPLKKSLRAAFKDAAKAPEFLNLCEEFVAAGKLVAGWNDYHPLPDNKWEGSTPKGMIAGQKAAAYDQLFKKRVSVDAVPQAFQ